MKGLSASVLFLGLISTLHAEILLQGYRSSRSETWFLLSDESGKVSPWLSLGDHFDGYRLERFSAQDDVLILRKEAREFPIPLAASRTRAGSPAPSPAPGDAFVLSIQGEPAVTLPEGIAALNFVRAALRRAGAMDPIPAITIYLGTRPAKERVDAMLRLVADVSSESKIKVTLPRRRPERTLASQAVQP